METVKAKQIAIISTEKGSLVSKVSCILLSLGNDSHLRLRLRREVPRQGLHKRAQRHLPSYQSDSSGRNYFTLYFMQRSIRQFQFYRCGINSVVEPDTKPYSCWDVKTEPHFIDICWITMTDLIIISYQIRKFQWNNWI